MAGASGTRAPVGHSFQGEKGNNRPQEVGSGRASHKKAHIVWLSWHDMPRIGKSIEQKDEWLPGARNGGDC